LLTGGDIVPGSQSDAVAASRPSSDAPDGPGEGSNETPAHSPSLVRRLEQATERDRLDADPRAAMEPTPASQAPSRSPYRGVIEEASVTIIRPSEAAGAPDATLTAPERQAARDRFLKALDGKY